MPIQDALNKAIINMLVATEYAAHSQAYIISSNKAPKGGWKRRPGTIWQVQPEVDLDGKALPTEIGSLDSEDPSNFIAVIEHLHDSPRDLLNDLLECVRTEGYLYITVPSAVNIRKRLSVLRGQTNYPPFDTFYWHPGPWRGHVREYTRGDLQRLASFLGLSVVELHSYHKMLSRIPRAARWVYRWVTAACTGWRDSWLLIAKKNPNWQPRKALSDEEFRRRLGNDEGFQY